MPLRLAVSLAAGFWAAAFAVLVRAPGTSPALVLGSAAFVAFFLASAFVYGKTSITVTRDGMVVATPFRRRPVRFEEILRVVVRDGLGGRVYAILTRRGPVHFTSLFARHRELFELILERARLGPQAA
ncbi:MAG TPA: hypothetical protein VIW03_04775 [Anaeromyxobacter sp.]